MKLKNKTLRLMQSSDLYQVQARQLDTDKAWWVTVGTVRKFRERGAWYYHSVVSFVGSKENNLFEGITFVLWKNGMSVAQAEMIAPSLIENVLSAD